jgi:hypothetical protein
MSIVNAITRGFGFRIGSNLANSLMTPKERVSNKVSTIDELECWSHKGFEEGDVDIVKTNWTTYQLAWYSYPLAIISGALVIPFLWYIKDLYFVFVKKHQMHFYDFKWNTYKVSDRRSKSGTRDVKNLEPVYCKTVSDSVPLRNKLERSIRFSLAAMTGLPVLITLLYLILTK